MRDFKDYEHGPNFDRARSQIATPFQYVDIDLDAAASNQIYNVSGDFLYVDAASTGSVTLELNNQYNDPSAPFFAQPGFGLAALFKQLKLSWTAQPGKFIRLMYSTGDRVVPTNSTTVNGYVNTVDGSLSRTLADQAFMGYAGCGAVAAQYSHTQLWNPAGSGKNLFLEAFSLTSTTTSSFVFGRYNVQLANAAGAQPCNKYFGHVTGSALNRFANNAAQLISEYMGSVYCTANLPSGWTFKEPVLIPPGQGFVLIMNAVNLTHISVHEHYEQPL